MPGVPLTPGMIGLPHECSLCWQHCGGVGVFVAVGVLVAVPVTVAVLVMVRVLVTVPVALAVGVWVGV